MTDDDLRRPVFVPLAGVGWIPASMALQMARGHTWSELTQLKFRAGRRFPSPSPSATHNALGFYMTVLTMFLHRDVAAQVRFTALMEFTGLAGGAWTIQVDHGDNSVTEGRAAHADLVMTQAPETFINTLAKMHNPMIAMLTGAIKVRGFSKLGTFGKLFGEPKLDDPMQPIGETMPQAA